MTSGPYRLMYTDGSDNDITIAVSGGDVSTDPDGNDYNTLAGYDDPSKLKNAKITYQLREVNSLKVWMDSKFFGDLPITLSEFGTTEVYYKLQRWDSSNSQWVNEFFGVPKNQGAINEDGELALKLYSTIWLAGEFECDVNITSSTSVANVIQTILNDNSIESYTVSNIDSNYSVTLDQYSLNDKIRKGVREITERLNLGIQFLPEKDANGNIKVQLIPLDYTDSSLLPTFAESEDYDDTADHEVATVREWEKGSTSDVINKIAVKGVDPSTKSTTTITVSDQTSIDTYGEQYRNTRVPWTDDSTVLNDVGNSYLTTEPVDGGRIKTPYRIPADQFGVPTTVLATNRSINESARVVKQEIFIPEGDQYVEFGFEPKIRQSANVRDTVDNEQQTLPSSNDQTVGPLNVDGNAGNAESDTSVDGSVASDPSDTTVGGSVDLDPSDTDVTGSVDSDPSDTDVTGSVDNDPSDTAIGGSVQAEEPDIVQYDSGGFDGNYSNGTHNLAGVNLDQDGLVYTFKIEFNELNGTCSNFGNLGVGVRDGNGAVHFFENDVTLSGGPGIADTFGDVSPNYTVWYQKTISFINISSGFFNLVAVLPNGGDLNGNFVGYVSDHSHGDNFTTTDNNHNHGDSFLTDDNNHSHGDSFLTDDNNHDHGDSFSTTDNNHPHGDDFSSSDLKHGGSDQPTAQQHVLDADTADDTINVDSSVFTNRTSNN